MRNVLRNSAVAVIGAVLCLLVLGTGSASAIIYRPASLAFGPQLVGTSSNPQQVDVGGGSCGPDYIGEGGYIYPGPCFPEPTDIAISGPFVITGHSCPASLVSPSTQSTFTCSIAVAFVPNSIGPQKGFLRLASTPAITGVPLAGTGCAKAKTVCAIKKKKKSL